MESYVVTRTWYLALDVPVRFVGWKSSYRLMTSRAFDSPWKGTTVRFGAHRANSRTQFVMVELGTTISIGKASQFLMILPTNAEIWTVFPCDEVERLPEHIINYATIQDPSHQQGYSADDSTNCWTANWTRRSESCIGMGKSRKDYGADLKWHQFELIALAQFRLFAFFE